MYWLYKRNHWTSHFECGKKRSDISHFSALLHCNVKNYMKYPKDKGDRDCVIIAAHTMHGGIIIIVMVWLQRLFYCLASSVNAQKWRIELDATKGGLTFISNAHCDCYFELPCTISSSYSSNIHKIMYIKCQYTSTINCFVF